MHTAYIRTPHTLITISGQVIEKKNVMTAYVKFMQDRIESFPAEQSNGKVPGIQFNCLDKSHVKDGSVTISVDGKLSAATTARPSSVEKKVEYINKKITEICEFLDVKFVNKGTFITDGFVLKEIPSRVKRRRASEPSMSLSLESKIPDHKHRSDDIIVRHSLQSPLARFHIQSSRDDYSPSVLKGDAPIPMSLEGVAPSPPEQGE